MATSTHAIPDANHLAADCAALRRRLYVVALLRGIGLLLAVLFVNAAARRRPRLALPPAGLVRAAILVWTLACHRLSRLPLPRPAARRRTDDLSLALRIEESYPSLNDALASTVAIPRRTCRTAARRVAGPAHRGDSPRPRQDQRLRLQPHRGHTRSVVVDTAYGPAASSSSSRWHCCFPPLAGTALARLADPFGGHEWPAQTRLTALVAGPLDGPVALIGDEPVAPPAEGSVLRVGRGQPFLVRGKLCAATRKTAWCRAVSSSRCAPEAARPPKIAARSYAKTKARPLRDEAGHGTLPERLQVPGRRPRRRERRL